MRSHLEVKHAVITVLFVSLLAGCVTASDRIAPTTEPTASAALIPIRNARIPIDGVLSGGQPTPEQIEQAARAGFATVINLRTSEEMAEVAWEQELVERLGMEYVHIPIAGFDGLTRSNIDRIDEALRRSLEDGPILFHCASGNRIGAALALRAAWIEGLEPADALDYGRASGMTRLDDRIREVLELPSDR